MNHRFDKDQQLLTKCFSGHREASETLVRQFSDLVYRSIQYTLMAKHVSFNKYDVEDFHNTVFLRLFEQDCKKLRQYRGKNGCSLASWIRMITVRTVIDHLRKKGVDTMVWQKKCTPLEDLPELRAEADDVGAQIEKAEQGRLLQEGLQRLSPRYRLFVRLHCEQGLSVAEVAETMQISVGNAYTVKHRAIEKLKSHVASLTNNNP